MSHPVETTVAAPTIIVGDGVSTLVVIEIDPARFRSTFDRPGPS